MGVRIVPPVESTVQQVLLKSPIDDQVLTRWEIGLKRWIDVGQLLPGILCCCDFLLGNEEPKIRKCKLRRKPLLQSDQMAPDVFCSPYFLFGNKQTQKRQVEIRSGWKSLL